MADVLGSLTVGQLAKVTILLIFSYVASALVYSIWLRPKYFSKLSHLPGPPSASWLFGNAGEIVRHDPSVAHGKWEQEYGHVYRYPFVLGRDRLFLNDSVALNHLLLHDPYAFQKPHAIDEHLKRMLGTGVLVVNDDTHRRHRRALASSFAQGSVNSYLPLFQQQANKFCDKLAEELSDEYRVLNIHEWFDKVALDVIALAGFDYNAGGLEGRRNIIGESLTKILNPADLNAGVVLFIYLTGKFPWLANLPVKPILNGKISSAALKQEAQAIVKETYKKYNAGDLLDRKDLIASLVKANAKDKHGLSDDEVMGQITTFLAAGMETSATTMSWTLLELSKRSDIQDKLRAEIHAFQKGRPSGTEYTVEDLEELPYLDAVAREVMRYHPAVTFTGRTTKVERVLPLGEAVKDINGKMCNSVTIEPGTEVIVPIKQWNLDERIFGLDAKIFNPDRWLGSSGQALSQNVSAKRVAAFPPLMTFIGGVRNCPGARFAFLEIKAVMLALVGRFEFAERDAGGTEFIELGNITTRMLVKNEREKGVQLPLRIRKVKA